MRAVFAAVLAAGAVLLPSASPAAAEGCAAPATTVRHERPWPQQRLAPEAAWQLTRGGGVTVAVVGTGVSAAPAQLAGAVLPGVDVRSGTSGGRGDSDCAGHGTFAASLIAARPASGVGLVGIAPDTSVLPVRVTTDPTKAEPSALAAGVRAAVDGGAGVVAVTLATGTDLPAMREAIETARRHDVLVVAPAALPAAVARQAAENMQPSVFPAALPGVVAVAAVDRDGLGEARGLAAAPTLAAPGEELTGLAPAGPGQVIASAAEQAVAFVAGAAALVRGRYPEMSAAEVTRRLTDTADHPSASLPDPAVGLGVVNPSAAVTAMAGAADTRVAKPSDATMELSRVPVTDPRPARMALVVAAGVSGLALLATLVAAAAVAARRRTARG